TRLTLAEECGRHAADAGECVSTATIRDSGWSSERCRTLNSPVDSMDAFLNGPLSVVPVSAATAETISGISGPWLHRTTVERFPIRRRTILPTFPVPCS